VVESVVKEFDVTLDGVTHKVSSAENLEEYNAFVRKVQPLLQKQPSACCEVQENLANIGTFRDGGQHGRSWHGRVYDVNQCQCGRVRVTLKMMA
jgi:hypothetical protein